VNVTSGRDSHGYVTESVKDGALLVVEFMRIEDAASVLRLSEREIYRLMDEGELEVHEYKRRKLIEPASVHAVAKKIREGKFATSEAVAA